MSLNFFRGHPTSRLLPNKAIHEAATKILVSPLEFDETNHNRHPLTYGSDEGALWVREEVAKFANKAYRPEVATKADDLNLTSGSSYGILNALLQTTLPHTGYTKRAFVITPTYFLINRALTDAGFNGKLTAIDEFPDLNSIDLKTLQEKLEFYDNEDNLNSEIINDPKYDKGTKKVYKFVLYCIPEFSNPGGITMNLETRLKLLELARKHDMLVVTDEVYELLDYTQDLTSAPHPKYPKLVHLDRATTTDPNSFGNTLNNSTFSKTIAPGLRVGYQEAINSNLVAQLSAGGANVSGGTPSQLNSNIVGELLKSGEFYNILSSFRTVFAERAVVLKKALEDHLPIGTTFTGFEGGYFQWVTLPAGYDAKLIIKEVHKKDSVVLAGGEHFEVTGDERGWGERSFRLCLAYLEADELEEGIKRVGDRINALYPNGV